MDNAPDPSTLTDEELDKVLAGEAIDVPTDAPEDDAPEQPETPEVTPPEDPEEPEELPLEEEPVEEPKPSRREQLRIQQLLERMKQPQSAPPAPQPSPNALDYNTALDADPEVIQQLEEDRQRMSQQFYEQGLKQTQASEWRTMLHIDSPQVDTAHPQLNQNDKENFHPAIADSVNSWYLQMSGFDEATGTPANPGIRYKDFVDGVFELAEEIASTKAQSAVKNIAKQAAQTGLRPDGSSAKRLDLNKDPEDMSDEELDTYLSRYVK